MSERYTRLFSLPGNLHTPKAPLLIMAGALLKDNVTGQVLAQVKYKNLGAKPIKALTVSLQALDTRGLPLGEPVKHQYLDLSAPRDSEFGQKEPIPFPDANTRGFSAQVRQVIFSDNSIWEAEGQPWESLPEQQTLEQALGDTELCKEYRSRFPGAAFFPREDGPLWRCVCGAWNEEGENTCHLCGKEKAALFSLDLGALKTSRDRRLAQEAQQKEEKQAAEAKKAKKRKKAGLIALGALVLVCAGAAAVILPQKMAQRKAGEAWVLTQETTVDYEGKKTSLSYSYDREGRTTEIDFGDGQKNTFTYDKEGNQTRIYRKGNEGSFFQTDYRYDAAGNQIEETEVDDEGDNQHITWEYDSAGRCIRETGTVYYLEEEYETTFTYDGEGRLVEERKLERDLEDGDKDTYLTLYRYGDNGLLAEESQYRRSDWLLEEPDDNWKERAWEKTISYSYDEKGRCTQASYAYDEDAYKSDTAAVRIQYTYDEKGNCVKEETSRADGSTALSQYTYDKKGNMLEKTYADSEGESKTTYSYDENGNCVKEVSVNQEGQEKTITRTYKKQYAPAQLEAQREEEEPEAHDPLALLP